MDNPNYDISSEQERTPLRSAPVAADRVPHRILISPWGHIDTSSGGFVVDDESADLVRRAFDDHRTDLPIDYEHQTLGGTYAAPNGQAPAAGWIKEIEAQPGVGLFARIEWTDPARTQLTAKQYRYLSPVAIVRKADRKLVAIHSVALTNKPAIVGMTPIVNRATDGDPEANDATPLDRLRTELDLDESVPVETILVAASRRLVELERQAAEKHVARRIDDALRSGRLIDAQRAWAEQLILRDEALFDDWLRTAPVVVPLGATRPPKNLDTGARTTATQTRARSEFRANPLLARLTTEDAFVTDALRATSAHVGSLS